MQTWGSLQLRRAGEKVFALIVAWKRRVWVRKEATGTHEAAFVRTRKCQQKRAEEFSCSKKSA